MNTLDRSIAPPVADFSDIRLCERSRERLNNGVDFSIVNSGEQAIWRLSLIWDGGSLDTPLRSLPLIMTEALREHSAKLSGAEIADTVDFNGARLTSRTVDHYSVVEIIALNSRLKTLLPLLSEIILNPEFDTSTVEMVARRAAARRAMQEAKVAYTASMGAIRAIAGNDHPSAVYESPDIIKSINPEQVAQTYADIVGRGHLHAYLAGRLSDEEITLVREFLLKMPAPNGQSIINIVPHRAGAEKYIFSDLPESRQSAVSMALTTIGRDHSDYIDLRLSVIALGGYFSSRLMSNIREEKGLTYGINAALMGAREGAYVSIDAQCDASYVNQVVDETRKEMLVLRTNPPRDEELRRVRRHAWTALANTADSPFATMDHYITSLLVGTPDDYFARQLTAVANLSPERIAELATLYLNPDELKVSEAGILS